MERRAGDRRRSPRPDGPGRSPDHRDPVQADAHEVYPSETPASILPQLPRVASLDALLREVDSLRLTLETDLSLAASAVEAGRAGLAADILESDRTSLSGFEQRALGHLHDLAEPFEDPLQPPVTVVGAPTRRRMRVPASPFVAAAAVAGFLLGVVPQGLEPGPTDVSASSVAAHSSLGQLQAFAAQGNTTQVRATARALHDQLRDVVSQAHNDPDAAQQALLLLSSERDAILQSGDSALLHDVLAQSTALANRIRAALPAKLRQVVPAVRPVVEAEPSAAPRNTASAKPSPAAKPSPTASPTPSAAPKPTSGPKPSSSPSPKPSGSDDPTPPTVLPSGNPVNP